MKVNVNLETLSMSELFALAKQTAVEELKNEKAGVNAPATVGNQVGEQPKRCSYE